MSITLNSKITVLVMLANNNAYGCSMLCNQLKNSLIIHEENTKKNHKRVVSVYVIQIHVDLHKL